MSTEITEAEITSALEAHANGAEVTGTPAFQAALLDCLIEARGRNTYFAWAEATTRAEDAESQVDALREALREFAELDDWIGNGVGSTSQEQWVMDTEHRIAERARALLAQETTEPDEER